MVKTAQLRIDEKEWISCGFKIKIWFALLDIERFKDKKFEFFKAKGEYWRFFEVDFVAWTGLIDCRL